MSITERIAASFGRLRSLLSKKEKIMSEQTVIENSAATVTPDASTLSPLESFANEVAVPTGQDATTSAVSSVAVPDAATPAVSSLPAPDAATSAVSSAPAPDAATSAASSAPVLDAATPAVSSAPVLDTSTPAVSTVSEAQPASVAATAPDLTQQLATPDTLANGSASAGPSSASGAGIRAEPPVTGASTDAVSQDMSASVKDFVQAFNFVESGVEKLGIAAKDELIALARKYM